MAQRLPVRLFVIIHGRFGNVAFIAHHLEHVARELIVSNNVIKEFRRGGL